MIEVFVTSDQHFFHHNIIKYCDRPFDNVDEMHHFMIQEWNKVVQLNDIIVHLGDYICGGSFEQVKEITEQLNGRKIIITGNHDRRGKSWFKRVGFERVFKHRWCMGMYCFSHKPQTAKFLIDNGSRYNLHGHSHKHDYGDPFYNFGVDVVGYKPKKVKLNLTENDLINGEGLSIIDPFIDYKNGKRRKENGFS